MFCKLENICYNTTRKQGGMKSGKKIRKKTE